MKSGVRARLCGRCVLSGVDSRYAAKNSMPVYSDPEIGPVKLEKRAVSRRVSIRVHPVDGVKVIIPRSLSYDEGLRFFVQKRDWIIKTVARQKKGIADAEARGKAVSLLGDGSVIRTLMSEIVFRRERSGSMPQASGRRAAGNVSPNPEAGRTAAAAGDGIADTLKTSISVEMIEDVKFTGRTWLDLDRPLFRKTVVYPDIISGKDIHGLDAILRKALVEILRQEAKLILPRKVGFFASRFGFRYGNIAVKHNSSNWGSCSRKGNINLNLNLVRLPEPLCDYVILHELCHLRYADHGQDFHSLLEKLCTDNIVRLSLTEDPYIRTLVPEINSSRSVHPVSRTLERELKSYRLV